MHRTLWIAIALALLPCAAGVAFAAEPFLAPGPGLRGNDTGGIIVYRPDLDRAAYRRIAADWCAHWRRLSHVTSEHRTYGDYVSFVCIDRPGVIH